MHFQLGIIAAASILTSCGHPTINLDSKVSSILDEVSFTLDIKGIKREGGQICYAVWNNPEGYQKEANQVAADCVAVKSNQLSIRVQKVPYSQKGYAVALFQDMNGNRKLDTGLFGIPTEGFGFSNNPRIMMSAPSFEDCRFFVTGANYQVPVTMNYF